MLNEMKYPNKKTIIAGVILFFLIILLVGGGVIYRKLYSPAFDIDGTVYIYIDERKNYQDLLLQLQTAARIKDAEAFKRFAGSVKYPGKMRTGRYAVQPEMTIRDLVTVLSNGVQAPVRLTFNNLRLKEDFARRMGEELMFDGDSLLHRLNDPVCCMQCGMDTATILCMFIPNTYEIYWNTGVDVFIRRMKKEYDRFWTPERRAKAEAIGMTPVQVSILASIVEEETAVAAEYPVVAGLYINRLRKGMLLQADPTVKYAVGDFGLRRILNVHLKTDSPYNTYIYRGLPPGPVRVPSIKGIDAVLNYDRHTYIYMCAKADFSGRHAFATNMADHNKNANRYRSALNARRIY
jgi:UPF0755 protein